MPTLDELKRQVVERPFDVDLRVAVGRLLLLHGEPERARHQLEKAHAMAPDRLEVLSALSRVLEAQGELERAGELLRAAVMRAPREAALRDELADLLMRLGRDDDALLHLLAIVDATHPGGARRLRLIAEIHRRGGRLEEARRAIEGSILRDADDVEAVRLLHELCLDLGDEAGAERAATARSPGYFLEQARESLAGLDLAVRFPGAALARAAASLRDADVAGARAALREASASEGAGASHAFLEGELDLAEGLSERAMLAFRRCVERDPGHAIAWNRLGDLARAAGQLREAVAAYRRGVALAPEDPRAQEDLGDLLSLLDERDGARAAYGLAARGDREGRVARKRQGLDGRPRGAAAGGAVGRIGVLGWTPLGGRVSWLEAQSVAGEGRLHLTGNVGATGREAAQVAHSCLRAWSARQRPPQLGALDLHLHFTDTELGKDGPSSGLALFLAGVSAMAGRPLRAGLAATGEITLHGELRPVGGVREKLVAAALGGVELVLAPRRNVREVRALGDDVLSRVRVVLVESLEEALAAALWDGSTGHDG